MNEIQNNNFNLENYTMLWHASLNASPDILARIELVTSHLLSLAPEKAGTEIFLQSLITQKNTERDAKEFRDMRNKDPLRIYFRKADRKESHRLVMRERRASPYGNLERERRRESAKRVRQWSGVEMLSTP